MLLLLVHSHIAISMHCALYTFIKRIRELLLFALFSDGACDRSRYRIRAFDPEHPGIGRVEIMLPDNQWYIICNDFWYDQEAAVVCRCLGYNR